MAAVMVSVMAFVTAGTASAEQGGFERERAFRNLMLESGKLALHPPSSGAGPPEWTFAVIPEFDYVSHSDVAGVIDGVRLKRASGDSRTWAVTFVAGKRITDRFKLSFLYKYSYTSYRAGLVVPDMPTISGTADINLSSHLAGLVGNYASDCLGKFEVSLMEAWDLYDGKETFVVNAGGTTRVDERSADAFDDRVFSFIVWWDKDFPVSETVTLDPYLGWRTVQVVLNDMNDFTAPGAYKNDSSTTHLASGGLKVKFDAGPLKLSVRAGVNRKITKNPIPGFASRAVAPGVINLGYMTCWDRTVATWGLGVGYVIPGKVAIDIAYNGAAGPETKLHTVTGAFVFMF
jgi:hypothetical protein